MNMDEFLNLIKEFELEPVQSYLEQNSKKSVKILLSSKETYKQVGNSRIAGFPDVPENFLWPRAEEGEPLTFIAQLNLAEIQGQAGTELLPQKGMLYFFTGIDEPAYDIEHKVIFVPEPSNLRFLKIDEPTSLELLDHYEETVAHCVHFKSSLSVPNYAYVDEKVLDEKGVDIENYFAFEESFYVDGQLGHMFAYPQGQHGDAEFAAALRLLAQKDYDYNPEKALDYLANTVKSKETAEYEVKNIQMLLELDSDQDVNFCWWDAGCIHYFLRKNDLLAGIFDRTYMSLYSS